MTIAIAVKLLELLFFFSVGFLVESWTLADEGNTLRNVGFNLSYSVIRTTFDLTVGLAFTILVWRTVAALHLKPLIVVHGVYRGLAASIAFSLIALFIHDLFYYWFHRLQHTSSWLWVQHELHHSDEHVNVTTATRHHWLETPLELLFAVVPATLVFEAPTPVVLSYLAIQGAGYFVHMNSRIYLGPFLGSPALHRVHHSKLSEHIDKNFAAYFPVLDILFGTYCPAPKIAPPTGLCSGETVTSFSYAVVMPFVKWRQMLHGRHAQ